MYYRVSHRDTGGWDIKESLSHLNFTFDTKQEAIKQALSDRRGEINAHLQCIQSNMGDMKKIKELS